MTQKGTKVRFTSGSYRDQEAVVVGGQGPFVLLSVGGHAVLVLHEDIKVIEERTLRQRVYEALGR